MDPAQPVAGDLVAAPHELAGEVGIALERRRDGEDVSGRLLASNSRRMRQTPARDPYSYIDSIVMWRLG
jgi:hypothetical protein